MKILNSFRLYNFGIRIIIKNHSYKPGRVCIILNGRYAGRKGIIVKTNYENTKDRKYPHCLVVGLAKGPRKASKRFLKKYEEKLKVLEEAKEDKTERIQRLKSLGIFVKTYNMAHLLATRYIVKENFGIEEAFKKVENSEKELKECDEKLKRAQNEGKKKENKDEVNKLKEEVGTKKDQLKADLKSMKESVGKEMLDRFMQGFVAGGSQEEKEKEENTHFLFKKLHF